MIWILATLVCEARAGVWVRAPGDVYAQLGVNHSVASENFGPSSARLDLASARFVGDTLGALFDDGDFASTELAAYAEYGVLPNVELYGSVPVRYTAVRYAFATPGAPDVLVTNLGLGELMLGARVGAVSGPMAMSFAAVARAPLYDNSPAALNREAGNSDLYDDRVPLGEGTIDLDLLGAVGTSFGFGWAQVEGGVRLRDRGFSTGFPARAQVGVMPKPWVGLTVDGESFVTFDDGAAPDFYLDRWGKGPIVVDGARFVRLGGGAFVKPFRASEREGLRELGLGLRGGTTVWGERTSATTGASLSVFWQGEAPWR